MNQICYLFLLMGETYLTLFLTQSKTNYFNNGLLKKAFTVYDEYLLRKKG